MKTKSKSKRNQVTGEMNRGDAPLPAASSRETQSAASPFQRKNILVPVDFSDCSRQALDYAIPFARQFRAGIALLHVIHVNYYATNSDFATYDYPELLDETRRAGEKQLDDLARSVRKKYPVETVIQTGHPGSLIVDTAKKQGVGLIITSTHGRTGFKRAFLGSTAEHVVRYASCPVLTVPGRTAPTRSGKASPFQLKKILVPIDFSETSAQALPYAGAAAERFGAELILLHVIAPVPLPLPLYVRRKLRDSAGRLAELSMDARLSRLCEEVFDKAIPSRTLVRTGVPYDEITKAASSQKADLIILTTHGHTGLKHVLLGSTAERVVRHADCPVLVVRKTERADRKRKLFKRGN